MGLFAKYKVIIGFRSGRTIKFKCDDANYTYSGGQVTSYSFDGMRGTDACGFALSEIESIQVRKLVS